MKSSLRRVALLASAFALAALLAACGGDDETTESGADASEEAVSDGEMAMDDGDMDEMSDDMDGHGHDEVIEVPEGMTVPTISISTQPDSEKGVNLFVDVADFEISPENASTDPVDGQGHLHLYVNGERSGRFYNTAVHLGDLPEGDHEIMVEISANDHSAYAVDGEPIRAMTTVSIEKGDHDHSHGDAMVVEAADPVPTIALAVTEDPKSGWNVAVEVTDFTFAPEAEGGDPVDGEGHLHFYIDGVKAGRQYGPDWHVAKLTEGTHELMVELSANNHMAYGVDGEAITAMATIEVSAEQAAAGGHEHDGHGDDHDHDDAAMDDDAMDDETAMDDGVAIDVSVADGEIDVESSRIDVALGSEVTITVEADIVEHAHLHGYDIFADIAPGSPGVITFTADVPGVFEVELEDSRTFLFEVAVS
ncbi:MAG: hypothetical protein AAGD35_19080 [Actinomycetota bacterium]